MSRLIPASNLARFPNLTHGFTTRELGIDYDHIARKIKVLRSQIYTLRQVHSSRVVYLGRRTELADLPEGDALVTDRKDVVIGVKTADCVPVLVYDERQEVVAAIHAGYKGLLGGIIQKTLRLLIEKFHCDVEHLWFALGPCICVAHYEVGADLIMEFERSCGKCFSFSTDFGPKPHLDLSKTARLILENEGARPARIADAGLCTFEHEDLFFSCRRQNGQGRQLSFIGMIS